MATTVKELAKRVLDELSEDDAAEVLDFVGYLRWRREEGDQSWFWTEGWQTRYREAKADLAAGRFRDFDDVEDCRSELNRYLWMSGIMSGALTAS